MIPDKPSEDRLPALRDIAPIEPPGALADRVRRHAYAEMTAAAGGDWLVMATRAWNRVGLPAALTVTVVGYLSWAVASASALYR